MKEVAGGEGAFRPADCADGLLFLPGEGLLLVNAQGRILFLDREALARLGPAAGGLVGTDVGSSWPELAACIAREKAALEAGPRDGPVGWGAERLVVRLFRTDGGVGVALLAEPGPVQAGGPRESLLLGVLGQVHDAVLVTAAEPIDSPGPVILYANPALLRQTGHRLEEVLGRSPRMFQGPATDPQARARFREAFEAWRPITQEICNYHRDGTTFWVEIAVTPLCDADGWFTHWVSVQREVTDRRAAEQLLAESEEHYRLLAENASDVVMRLGEDGRILWVSPSLTPTLGWEPAQWEGKRGTDFLEHGGSTEEYRNNLERVRQGKAVVARDRVRARDGLLHWVETHASPYRTAEGRIEGMVASFRIVDAKVASEEELARRATTDELTGLLNRAEILAQIGRLTDTEVRTGGRTAVMFCDFDGFKEINDRHGHLVGDEVLRKVAQRIRSGLRSSDLAARMGGDELLLVLTGVQDLANALQIAEKLRAVVREPIPTSAGGVRISLSVGLTMLRRGEGVAEVVGRADAAMYRAKEAGGDRVIASEAEAQPPAGGAGTAEGGDRGGAAEA